jgi:hypothetical protein
MEYDMVPDASRQLRQKVQRYRTLARSVNDQETSQRILAFTDELEQEATMIERTTVEQISERARELWGQARKPEGRDEEFWDQAEQELQEIALRKS